jgi:cell wall-associated NlpC family hydrolase
MRKGPFLVRGMCAAALLWQVSLTFAEQSQASGQQSTAQQSPQTAKPTSSQKVQAAHQSPQAGKQASVSKAQIARPPAIPPGYRLLSLKEGRTLVQEISWADDEEGLSPDCSHLVHQLYEQAGHPYPYASSLDLYRGTGPFLRVRYAHPGDLVVWRGHVGIVVNPRDHSFFSTTSSGARNENYRSAYWRARGYPHFFRYLTKSPLKDGLSEASNRPPAS